MRPDITNLLALLADQERRWRSVRMGVPAAALIFLSTQVNSQLPLLSSIRLDILGSSDYPLFTEDLEQVTSFRDAPNLRHVEISGIRRAYIPLPFHQLHHFKITATSSRLYREAVQCEPAQLKSIYFCSYEPTPHQPTLHHPVEQGRLTLRALTRLSLTADLGKGFPVDRSHLDGLVLPALTELDIREWGYHPALYKTVKALLIRSNCHLQRLTLLGANWRPARGSQTEWGELQLSLFSLFNHCAHVTYLELVNVCKGLFPRLIPDPSSPDPPPLPALETLVLRCNGNGVGDGDTVTKSFVELFLSRTTAITNSMTSQKVDGPDELLGGTSLKEVRLELPVAYRFYNLVESMNVDHLKRAGGLARLVEELSWKGKHGASREEEVRNLVEELERIKLTEITILVMSCSGVVDLLNSIGYERGGLEDIQRRIEALLSKWKEYLDNPFGYRWSHDARGNGILSWRPPRARKSLRKVLE